MRKVSVIMQSRAIAKEWFRTRRRRTDMERMLGFPIAEGDAARCPT